VAINTVNTVSKAIKTGLDTASPLIQGLPTILSGLPGLVTGKRGNAKAWGNAVVKAYWALLDENVRIKYMRENAFYINEASNYNYSIGALQEHRGGGGGTEALKKVLRGVSGVGRDMAQAAGPDLLQQAVGKTTQLAGKVGEKGVELGERHFQTFLDVLRTELWKSYRLTMPPQEYNAMGQFLDSLTLSGRVESSGVGAYRALFEKSIIYATSYYRSMFGWLNTLFQPGVTRKESLVAAASIISSTFALYFAGAVVFKMKKDDIAERMVPGNDAYLKWAILDEETGETTNVGIGTIFMATMNLLAGVLRGTKDAGDVWRFLRTHSSPVVSTGITMAEGRNPMGSLRDKGEAIKELGVPQWGEKDKEMGARTLEFFGASTYTSEMNTKDAARILFPGKKLEDLDNAQYREATRMVEEFDKYMSPRQKEAAAHRKHTKDYGALIDVHENLTAPQMKWLEKNKLELKMVMPTPVIQGFKPPGAPAGVGAKAVKRPMTADQQKVFIAEAKRLYRIVVAQLMKRTDLSKDPQLLQLELDLGLKDARRQATWKATGKEEWIEQEPLVKEEP